MGFTIFESSGTFNPSNYGLGVGDLLHIIVVGGGGGGAGTANNYTAGTAGGASSFGSILTAAGGLAPVDNNSVVPDAGSFRGANGVTGSFGTYENSGTTTLVGVRSVFGGGGADGWRPGVVKGRSGLSSIQFSSSVFLNQNSTKFSFIPQDRAGHVVNFVYQDGLVSAIPASNQMAGSGGVYLDNSTHTLAIGGAGGIGYGAGGGGGCTYYDQNQVYMKASAGGNSGVIAQKDHLLTSMASIAVTVGKGGAGGTGYAGGAGADGCVAIFW